MWREEKKELLNGFTCLHHFSIQIAHLVDCVGCDGNSCGIWTILRYAMKRAKFHTFQRHNIYVNRHRIKSKAIDK